MLPIFNPATAKIIETLRTNPPQSMLLEGVEGVGLLTTAKYIAGKRLASVLAPTDKNDEPDLVNGIIRVSEIRSIYDAARGKSVSERFFIIDNADAMNTTAQNAFLKLLEEPQPNIHFILTSHAPKRLLPTITSRTRLITILPITDQQTRDIIHRTVKDQSKARQLTFLAGGRPAELSRLMASDQYFNGRSQMVQDARILLEKPLYERIQVINAYAADRSRSMELIKTAEVLLTFMLRTKFSANTLSSADRLADAYETIASNGNVKLQLLAAVI